MKILTRMIPASGLIFRRGVWFTPLLLMSLVSLEVLGRRSASELHDIPGAAALIILLLGTLIRHRSQSLEWIAAVERFAVRASRRLNALRIDVGLDLRLTPVIPRRLPQALVLGLACLMAINAAAALVWYYIPGGWRGAMIHASYLVYLSVAILLWGLLFLTALAGVWVPAVLLGQWLSKGDRVRGNKLRVRRLQMVFLATYVPAVSLAIAYLPMWIPPTLCVTMLVVLSLASVWPVRRDIEFIWRHTGTRRVFSISIHGLTVAFCGIALLSIDALILASIGGLVQNRPEQAETMVLSTLLGVCVAWLAPGLIACALAILTTIWMRNPSRPAIARVHISGGLVAAERRTLIRVFRAWGWSLRLEPRAVRKLDVPIRLVVPEKSQASEFDPDWPLRVSVADLEIGAVRDRLERRDEIQKRRVFLRGLEKLFRYAAGREHSDGSGYWVAPHLWLMRGLVRDDIAESDDQEPQLSTRIVGTPWHEIFEREVRAYIWKILRDLEIDLIYVEDGISARRLVRLFRTIFEIHDKSSGRRRAEEIHFRALHDIRVMIHDFQLDNPFRSNSYPEPKFDDLGRARILHVFRDRGGEEVPIESPFDYNSSPSPAFLGNW